MLTERGTCCLALDLPGFGGSAHVGGFDLASMTEQAVQTIHALRRERGATGQPWVVGGHSMGGTVASLIARRALEGEKGLEELRGLVLVSPSPPGPEPMDNAKRSQMLEALGQAAGNARQDRKAAERFVDENTGKLALLDAVRDRAVEGVLGMNRTAFRAWMEYGSKEDWRNTIGQIALPAMVFAGTEDGALGPKAQQAETMPHLPQGELIVLEGAGHLAPLERAGELAEYLTQFLAGLGLLLATTEARPGPQTAAVMQSVHTSPKTLGAMTHRLERSQDWNGTPQVFSAAAFRTLRALAACVVPHAGFDLAACIDAQLASNVGDGWRYALLPGDMEAWQRGLDSLDLAADWAFGATFVALHPEQQAALLQQAADGKLGPSLLGSLHIGAGARAYSAEAIKHWFEDVRAECTRLYMGDPRTMDRIGYTGFADDLGFTQIQLGQQEEFER